MSEIVIKNVSKTFSGKNGTVEALRNVNIEVTKGDIYGVIGMSGAGKSTLVRCLNYLERPDQGDVIISGRNLKELSEKELRRQRQQIAMIFQHFNLLMQKNVIDNICFSLLIQGEKKKDAVKKAKELLKVVGLEEKGRAYPSQLSGGQKQRVAIARALASSPSILLCDEATSALDPETTSSILELLKDINQKMNITIVMITHQMNVVTDICKHVAIMSSGEVVEEGAVEEIFAHPKSDVAKRLILGRKENVLEPEPEPFLAEAVNNSHSVFRVVFTSQPSATPVIANMVLEFGVPINILYADTRNIGGTAKGEMLIELPEDKKIQDGMIQYLKEQKLEVEEVGADVK